MIKLIVCNEIEIIDYFKFINYVCYWLFMEIYYVGKVYRRLG